MDRELERRSSNSPFFGWYTRFNADVVAYPPYPRHPCGPMAQAMRDIQRANPDQLWPATLLEEHVVIRHPYSLQNGRSDKATRLWFNKTDGTVPILIRRFRQRMDIPGTDKTADSWCFSTLFLTSR